MPGFMDATCRCGKRIGWFGEATDRPPCPKCGHQIPKSVMEKDQKLIDDAFKEMNDVADCVEHLEPIKEGILQSTDGQTAMLLAFDFFKGTDKVYSVKTIRLAVLEILHDK